MYLEIPDGKLCIKYSIDTLGDLGLGTKINNSIQSGYGLEIGCGN